jgi:YVTN family beta-propeller protein
MSRTTLIAAALAATVVAAAAPAGAQTIVALVGNDTLAVVDAGTKKVERTIAVTGLSAPLVGIDVRPADGMLYGLSTDGVVFTIDSKSGAASRKAKLETMLPAGVAGTVDFNPVADRLRVIGADGMNLRANVDDGKVIVDGALKFADTDAMKGTAPRIVAGAYTNSMKGAKDTALYDIDAAAGVLVKQAPPNDGVLTVVGKLGVTGAAMAFDIVGTDGYLMAGDTLHKVDLATGKATVVARITGVSAPVRDIAVLPAM